MHLYGPTILLTAALNLKEIIIFGVIYCNQLTRIFTRIIYGTFFQLLRPLRLSSFELITGLSIIDMFSIPIQCYSKINRETGTKRKKIMKKT